MVIDLDKEHGVLSPVTSGKAMCPVMIVAHPESMRSSSVASNDERDLLMTGRAICESTCVSPCPGKCFEDGAIPAAVRPRLTAVAYTPTSFGSVHKKLWARIM